MVASVAKPALTIRMMRRGRSSEATKSANSAEGTKSPSWPCSAIISSVRAEVRFHTATRCPRRARLRARLEPITAIPMTPMCARLFIQISSTKGVVLSLVVLARGRQVTK